MSYCRFAKNSDVYLVRLVMDDKFHCVACRLNPTEGWFDDTVLDTRKQALTHVRKHLLMKHKVPKHTIRRLKAEIAKENV